MNRIDCDDISLSQRFARTIFLANYVWLPKFSSVSLAPFLTGNAITNLYWNWLQATVSKQLDSFFRWNQNQINAMAFVEFCARICVKLKTVTDGRWFEIKYYLNRINSIFGHQNKCCSHHSQETVHLHSKWNVSSSNCILTKLEMQQTDRKNHYRYLNFDRMIYIHTHKLALHDIIKYTHSRTRARTHWLIRSHKTVHSFQLNRNRYLSQYQEM